MSDQSSSDSNANTEPVTGVLAKIGEGSGALGTVVSAMGCAMCFPAIASIGAAIGLGFLEQWEGLFLRTLMPLFALLALLANAVGWFAHRSLLRALVGISGPVLVLLALYPLFMSDFRNAVLYAGLALMVGFALWDIFIRPRGKKP
ncbi:Mercuric transport protein, MerC [hydrothermal vent metagenome]|uniref:Mercuric transport protein, MerC n=1 Tax=hydrothermal vent metagenome TaxID=652676 RepID=A0A3B0RQZ2_9ZZZZ